LSNVHRILSHVIGKPQSMLIGLANLIAMISCLDMVMICFAVFTEKNH